MHTLHNVLAACALTAVSFAQLVSAGDSIPLEIRAKSGKETCQSNTKQIGDATAHVELCVVAGRFAHDTYILNVDRQVVLKGIDDETTQGLTGTYLGEKISLICTPQLKAPAPQDISPESVAYLQKQMKLSEEDARKMAILTRTVETGRLCAAHAGAVSIIEVQVLFD